MTTLTHIPLTGLAQVNDEDSLRSWVRFELRNVFPHQCCVLSAALPGINGMKSSLIGVDFPDEALRSIISAGGGIDTPVVRRWRLQETPQLFDANNPWEATCNIWLAKFRYFGMRNTAAHGMFDPATGFTSYFSFLNVPDINDSNLKSSLIELQQPLSAVLLRLLAKNHIMPRPAIDCGLSKREQEIAWWVTRGKSNWEIAMIVGICESTVKFHVANLLRKLEINSRSQLSEAIYQRED